MNIAQALRPLLPVDAACLIGDRFKDGMKMERLTFLIAECLEASPLSVRALRFEPVEFRSECALDHRPGRLIIDMPKRTEPNRLRRIDIDIDRIDEAPVRWLIGTGASTICRE